MSYRLYIVRGDSMSPTFNSGDVLIVNESAYRHAKPKRGDVVIVNDPSESARHSLKRVIGLPGESLRLAEGMLWIDDEPVRELYLRGRPSTLGLDELAWELPLNECFVMGDNRTRSTDSRTYGPVSVGSLVGKVSVCIWPLTRAGRIRHGV